jgi:hypothetical protein
MGAHEPEDRNDERPIYPESFSIVAIHIGNPPQGRISPRIVFGPPSSPGEIGLHRPIAMLDTPAVRAWIDGIRERS